MVSLLQRRRLPLAILATVLGAILGFLYLKSADADTLYFEKIALLRQIKQVDARWELDALKARMGLVSDYDPLVDPVEQLGRLEDALLASGAGPARAGALVATHAGSHAELRRMLDLKTGLMEDFKLHNAVLRNSMAFLPTAGADLHAVLRAPGGAAAQRAPELQRLVDRLLLDTMTYSHAVTEELAAQIRADLARLGAARRGLPPAVDLPLQTFAAHVDSVLREQPLVNGLLARISAVPTAAAADALDRLFTDAQHQASQNASTHRHALLGFSAALVALIVYAAASLIRSHAAVQRGNLALRHANTTLEERVAERTRELHAAQSELLATARHAGRAEIANNVLHNVGNVLNSVNVSVGVLGVRLRASGVDKLALAMQLMGEHRGDLATFLSTDPRGKVLPAYLERLVQALQAGQAATLAELADLTLSVDHIKAIVASQQAHAGTASFTEAVRIGGVIDEALRMSAASLARHRVQVVRRFQDLPELMLDRQRLLQIVVNLVNNAKQAMDEVHDRPRRLTLDVHADRSGDEHRLRVCVSDEGHGIAPDNLTRIFQHGFTTRREGHGFGLHSCVLAAREMGGTLAAHSDGAGRGATFSLELPLLELEPAA